jgi:hypothetical protein
MKLPPPTKRLVKLDELLGRSPLRGDILLFKIELLALGVEDVEIISQAAIVSFGRELGCAPRARDRDLLGAAVLLHRQRLHHRLAGWQSVLSVCI